MPRLAAASDDDESSESSSDASSSSAGSSVGNRKGDEQWVIESDSGECFIWGS